MRRRAHRLAGLCALAALASAGGARGESEAAAAARALWEGVPAQARSELCYPFDSGERGEVRFAPFLLDGLRVGDLDAEQRALVEALLAASLSRDGLEKVRQIRALEVAVSRKDEESATGWMRGWMRDPGRYFVALFGEPGAEASWGYRFEGHHVSLHWTELPGEVPASTPLFLGAEPRAVPEDWPGGGVQPLREEEEQARALYASLDPAQRARARLAYASGRALLHSDERQPERPEPVGLARAAMSPAQQAAVDGLIDVYLENFAAEVAARRRAELDAAGRDAIHFAWTDAETPPNAFYYRIQGPSFLIEVDNTSDGDHVHAVWRDFGNDWGADLLAAHYQRAHGLRLAAEP